MLFETQSEKFNSCKTLASVDVMYLKTTQVQSAMTSIWLAVCSDVHELIKNIT